jgi:hypothetical protein
VAEIQGVHLLRVAPATGNTQWETDSGATYVFLEPLEGASGTFGVRKLPRNTMRGDNEENARIVGPVELPTLSFITPLRGLNSNTGGAVTAAKLTDLVPLFDALFGVAANGGTGSTASLTGSTSSVLRLADASGIGVGDCILFNDGAELVARFVLAKSSNDLTLSHTYSGAPTDSSTAFAGIMWYLDSDAPNHTPLHADFEASIMRRKAYGLLPDVVIDFPNNGDFARCNWSLTGVYWGDSAEANPSFAAPTAGSEIPCIDGYFSMSAATSGGSTAATATEYIARDVKLSITHTRAPVLSQSALSGTAKHVVTKKKAVLEATLMMGTLTGEAADTVLNTLQGATAQDILFQVGRSAGATCVVRMPNADIDAQHVVVDGMDAIKITATGARSGFHSTVPGSLQLGLF